MNELLDWEFIWQVERDIWSIFVFQAFYGSLDGDLSYDSIYNQPYWDVLSGEIPTMPEEDGWLLANGTLVIIACMCDEVFSGAGTTLQSRLKEMPALLAACRGKRYYDPEAVDKTLQIVECNLKRSPGKRSPDAAAEIAVCESWLRRNVIQKAINRLYESSNARLRQLDSEG